MYPRTYREKYWGALAGTFVTLLVIGAYTFRDAPDLLYVYPILFLFNLLNLAATRLVLHEDRIESINIIARRSLRRDDIDRLEVREIQLKSRMMKNYFLISKDGQEKPLMVPNDIEKDEIWFDWIAPIPEVTVPPPQISVKGMAMLMAVVSIVALTGPALFQAAKPYFDIFHLLLPWLVCLYVFTSDRFKQPRTEQAEGKSAAWIVTALVVSPFYMIALGNSFGTFIAGSDMRGLIFAGAAASLLSLAVVRYSPIDSLCLKRDWPLMMVMMAALYGYGAARTANELFDLSQPQYTPVPIASKDSGSFFKLVPWGAETIQRSYRPNLATYNSRRVGDSVCAELHAGALGMRWYQLSDSCPAAP